MRWFAALLLLGCQEPVTAPVAPATTVGEAKAEAPDLVLLLVTGLRAGGDGAEAAFWSGMGRTPRLRFANAYAQASAPFTSLGSLLTGRYVGSIPMCGRLLAGERAPTEAQQAWCARIPEDRHTLPEVLGVYGYHSALVTAGVPGAKALATGFQKHSTAESWDGAVSAAVDWWTESPRAPRLLVVVLGDGGKQILGRDELPRFPERKLQWLEPVSADIAQIAVDPDTALGAYKAGAAQAGRHLGSVLAAVTSDSARPTWTIAGSTSGVSLTERSGFHSSPVPLLTDNLLLERTIHVPLGIFGPGSESVAEVVAPIVELVDVFPTMAAWAGAVVPAGAIGTDLTAEPRADGLAYGEFGDMLSVREGEHLLVFRCTLHNATSLDPGITTRLVDDRAAVPSQFYSLHDVVQDPLQRTDVRASEPEVFDAMRRQLIALRTGPAAIPDGAISPERLWALRMAPSDGYW